MDNKMKHSFFTLNLYDSSNNIITEKWILD
jgi:hypothetical protein